MEYNYGRGRITAPGRFSLFEKRVEIFKVPRIGLAKVRLGQRLNIPTQGCRVTQTRKKPFSLMAPGSDPHPQMGPGCIDERPTC